MCVFCVFQIFLILQELRVNSSSYLDLARQRVAGTNVSALAGVVREELCKDGGSEYLLSLPNQEQTRQLVGSLCNLTMEQFQLLILDLQSDVNNTLLIEQVCKVIN